MHLVSLFKSRIIRLLLVSLGFGFLLFSILLLILTRPAHAIANYVPTGGNLQVGSENTITSGATSGNVGSWRGTLGTDATSPGFNWNVTSNGTSGLDQQIQIDDVSLSGANKMQIVIRASSGATSLVRLYQICDWVSTANVDTAADGICTGGGWRTMNLLKANITATAITNYTWHIYDGYWTTSTTGNTTVSTPLSNFISPNSDRRVLLRAYSTSAVTVVHTIDQVTLSPVIDSTYSPAGFTQITGGTVSTSYINTTNLLLTGQSGSDNNRLQVPGTAGAISDFYLSYKNVKTFTGMNTIVVSAEYSCSAATGGLSIKPKIYNFNSSSWEDLTSTTIACSTSEVTGQFAKNNITISNYISNGEIRVGWYGSGNSTTSTRLDNQYIILGATNTDSALCEISFGTGTATDCTNTRDLDSTLGSPSVWQQTTELESTTFGHDFYGYDNDRDATSGEAAASANLSFSVTPGSNARITALGYAMRWRSNSTTVTTQGGFRDYQGDNATVLGGWTGFGTTNLTVAYAYEDNATNGYFLTDPQDYIDKTNNLINIRVRTAASTNTTSATPSIDFAMVTLTWTENSYSVPTLQSIFSPTGGNLAVGTAANITSGATSGNVGSWKGTLASDATSPGHNWTINSNASSGIDQQVQIDNVQLNGANSFNIIVRAAASATSLSRAYQICDWTSSTNVDTAADGVCTGGGWRTLNIRKVNLTATAITNYTWHIYDGYWTTSTTSNSTVSTPLSNFIKNDATKRVLIRAYSTSAVSVTHTIDWVSLAVIIDSTYSAGGLTQITGGTITNSYINTTNGVLTGQTASDNTYLNVPGTAGAISDFYLSYKNVKTYTGMNTIVVVAEYGCSTTGVNIKPKIYNFNSSAWEDLTTATIACNATDAVGQFAKNNVTISNYISSGEIRIGWYGSGNNTLSIKLDYQYIVLGSTNTDSASCEISFGTGTATDCTRTRDLDGPGTTSAWQPTTELESTSFGHTFYGSDNDGDATSGEAAVSVNLSMTIIPNKNTAVTYMGYSMRWRSNSTTVTTTGAFKDRSGTNATVAGGWTAFGTTNLTAVYAYEDQLTNGYFLPDPSDYINRATGLTNIKLRTSASTNTTSATPDIDFMMATINWVEGPEPVLEQEAFRLYNNANSADVGSTLAAQNTTATLAGTGDAFRIRLLVADTVAQEPLTSTYKLQYVDMGSGSCASPSAGTPSSYTDVSTGTLIAFKDNAAPADGDALTTNANDPTSSNTIYRQTYVEANNFSNTITAIPESTSAMWDFALFDNGAPGTTTYCFRVIYSDGTVLGTYSNYPSITTFTSGNTAPDFPASIAQKKTDDTVISTGGWINATSVKFTATATDPDASDTLYLCVEYQILGVSFTDTEVGCGSGVAYSGSSVSVDVTLTGLTDASEYHWQARVKDAAAAYSTWVQYGGNAESARDFGLDTTAPTALTVYDGTSTGSDSAFNSNSLSSLSANWGSLNANVSGLFQYEYSIGTTSGGTDILTWTNNSTSTSVTASSLTLQSSVMYFFNVRVTDNATNTATFSSDGQRVLPSLAFTLSSSAVSFDNLNNSNSFTDTRTTTLTTSTNAYNGYVVRLYKTDGLRSIEYPAITIPDFSAGSYASPAAWSGVGFGYTSDDTLIQGVDKFNSPTCAGGGSAPCYSPFSSSAPGDIIADHTANVSGSPISNEQFNITYKVATSNTQAAGNYSTTLIYTIVPQY